MVPRSLRRQLNRLRRRERLLRLTWAAARCLIVFSVVLAAACLIDFVVDLYRDTPRWLRLGLLGVQAALWLAGAGFILRFLIQRFSDTEVALWIEDRMPELGHRLISAVQLNRPAAATAGMSPEMIAAVTRQAEDQSDRERGEHGLDRILSHEFLAVLLPVEGLRFRVSPRLLGFFPIIFSYSRTG